MNSISRALAAVILVDPSFAKQPHYEVICDNHK